MCSDLDFDAADDIVRSYLRRGGQPGIAYGIVSGAALVHSSGFGSRALGGPAPHADTVFRIASMSKSFTASSVMLLRDSGLLALDDLAETYVPELAGWDLVAPDADRVTIRHLLTMTAGFPTDDPWGDRQQGLPLEEFGRLLAGGVSFSWAPGTRFEYSNMGYAILGRVVSAASGIPYDEFVRTRLLEPLGMSRTGFSAEEFGGASAPAGSPPAGSPAAGSPAAGSPAAGSPAAGSPAASSSSAAGLAQGYRRGAGGWEEVPFEPYGAFAPMGGVFSCVSDLARWVAGFASAFPPGAGAGGDRAHPVRRASRREMQLPQAVTGWSSPERLPGGAPEGPAYYGFGLFVDEDPALGRVVSHSGGYPGFGSNMRWHPATGTGVIALANGTYAGMSVVAGLVLRAIVPPSPAHHVTLAPAADLAVSPAPPEAPDSPAAPEGVAPGGGPWEETLAACAAVDALLQSWDDAAADALFTPNVAWDAPYPERRHTVEQIRERIGEFRASGIRPAVSDTPAHRRWWLTGERGTVQVQVRLNPERPPRVQSLTLAVPPAPGSVLARVLESVVAWMNGGAREWPSSVPLEAGADAAGLARRLRMAAIWAGRCQPGAFRAGDGTASVSVELDGEHATVVLTVGVNPATGELRQAEITV